MSPREALITRSRSRGSAVLGAALLSVAVGGLALGLLTQAASVRRSAVRSEESARSLEAAETGVAFAELEIAAMLDPDADGVGTLVGEIGGSTFRTTAVQDPAVGSHWTVTSKSTRGLAVRTIEVGLKRIEGGTFVEGLFSHSDLFFDGKTSTDAYDSRNGTYASQATQVDADGTYALVGGQIGSNSGFIELHGSSVTVRGDAIPGPGRSVLESGNPTVTGDVTPRKYERDLPPTTLAEFQAAFTTNANGTWTAAGGNLTYKSGPKSLTLAAGGTLTLSGGTYFFSDFSLSGGSILKITGPVKVYVTGSFDLSGGTLLNMGAPADLQIFAHPYSLPASFTPTTTDVKIAGGSAAAFTMYGPSAKLTVSGNSDIFGAAVADQIVVKGSTNYHYDKALDDIGYHTVARMQRLYWREPSPPRR